MPYRTPAPKRGKLSGTSECHLLVGRCLIPFACQICSSGPGRSRAMGVEPYTLNADAAAIWRKHRERLLTLWRDPAGLKPGASGFSSEGLRGAGRLGLPCWGELHFEKAKLPKQDKAWPNDIKDAWRELKEA